jgi:hypothetical protein
MPAKLTSRQDRLHRAILSLTSRNPRRSRRTASGKPADKSIRTMARLDAAPADHWHMPCHQERISGRRYHVHAGDRQVNGQPSPPRRSRRAVMQRSRRPARSGSPTSVRATITCCCAAYIVAICRSVVMPYLCGWNLRAAIFRRNAVDPVADRCAEQIGNLITGSSEPRGTGYDDRPRLRIASAWADQRCVSPVRPGAAICPRTTTFVVQRIPVPRHHHVVAALRGLGGLRVNAPHFPWRPTARRILHGGQGPKVCDRSRSLRLFHNTYSKN